MYSRNFLRLKGRLSTFKQGPQKESLTNYYLLKNSINCKSACSSKTFEGYSDLNEKSNLSALHCANSKLSFRFKIWQQLHMLIIH